MLRVLSVTVPLTLLACVHTRHVPPTELVQLDGFDTSGVSLSGEAPGRRYVTLQDLDGEGVAFTDDSWLRLTLADGRSVDEHFRVIQVRDGVLSGTSKRGAEVVVPLERVNSADVTWLNGGLTSLAVIGGLLGTAGAISALIFILSLMFRPIPGRALRIDGKPSVAAVCANVDWVARDSAPNVEGLSPRTRAQLAKAWLADAQAEHASVAAFSRLSTTLLAVGAPPELIAAAHRAALEEIDHARRTFALASAYAGQPLGPAPMPALLAAPTVSHDVGDAISQLAVESLVDGCLNEGLAAALAATAAHAASDASVRTTLELIARDEASHRELAWSIVAWCARVDDRAREAVVSTVHRLPRTARFDDAPAELSRHGRLEGTLQREIFDRVRTEVVERAQQLGAGSAGDRQPRESGLTAQEKAFKVQGRSVERGAWLSSRA